MTSPSTKRLSPLCLLVVGPLLLGGCGSRSNEIPLVNAGFEQTGDAQDPVPGWRLNQHAGSPAYEMTIDPTTAASGHASFRMHRLAPQFYGSIAQPAAVPKKHHGKVLLTAQMKTQDVGRKGWVLALTIVGPDGNQQIRAQPLSGTHGFAEVSVSAKLPDNAQAIEVSVLLLDEGTGWLDDVRVRIDAD